MDATDRRLRPNHGVERWHSRTANFATTDVREKKEGCMFDRTKMRDDLMKAARGAMSVLVIDEQVEQLTLAHQEREAAMAPAEFNAEVARSGGSSMLHFGMAWL